MKEIVLSQRFQFYTIEPYRTFSRLDEKVENKIQQELDIELDNVDFLKLDIFNPKNDQEFSALVREKFKIKLHNKGELKKKNTKYFYSNNNDGEFISLDRWSNRQPTFYTTKERHLLKHFGRPFSSVSVSILERSITFDGTSVSVRHYFYGKNRSVNGKFFKKRKSAYGFKINLKTGNVITYEGNETPRIRQNNFRHLAHVVELFFGRINDSVIPSFGSNSKNHPINLEAKEIFNDEEFIKSLSHLLLSKFPHNKLILTDSETKPVERVCNMVMGAFISINEIKVPNNFQRLIIDAYPTKHFLKKNENKLVASVLDRIGIKSKGTIKLLHKYPELDIRKLLLLGKYFGYNDLHKYIHNLNDKFFTTDNTYKDDYLFGSIYNTIKVKYEYDLKDSEKKCLLKLINELFETTDVGYTESTSFNRGDGIYKMQFNTFNDHLDLLMRIRNYLPDVEMRVTTLKDFHHEHLELSKIDRAIKKGYSIKYVFEEKLINHIEKPIEVKNESGELIQTYYPVILKIDAEYSEEGTHMHHCVASYADKERSIIISLREGSSCGHERVTCEYNTADKECIQEKYFCNAKPPERFDFALDRLLDRIISYKGSIKSTEKVKIPLVINGVQLEVKKEETFLDFLQNF